MPDENDIRFSARLRHKKGCYRAVGTIQMHEMLLHVFYDNFTKPWSAEYNLFRLLSDSF